MGGEVRQRDRDDVVLHEGNEGRNEGNRVNQGGELGLLGALTDRHEDLYF